MSGRAASALLWILVAAAPAAWASEEAAAREGIPWATLLFSSVNFLLFVWLLAKYLFPPIRTWVAERRTRVVRALDEAAAAKAEALKLRAEWEARLAAFNQSVEELRAQARRDAERERDRILDAARKTAEAILKDAERAAAYETQRVRDQLRAELVRHAVRLAEEAARAQVSDADQERFVGDFLRQVGR